MGSFAKSETDFPPFPEDEYDSYLQRVLHLVCDGATSRQISEYLTKVEKEYLMLTSPAGSKDDFIRAVFQSFERTSAP